MADYKGPSYNEIMREQAKKLWESPPTAPADPPRVQNAYYTRGDEKWFDTQTNKYPSIDDAYDKYSPKNKTEREIIAVCNSLAELLIDKNRAYGNSALEPNRIFAKSDSVEQLKVRIDDKLNRIMKGSEFPGEDTVDDLLGYLVLLKIALRDNWR